MQVTRITSAAILALASLFNLTLSSGGQVVVSSGPVAYYDPSYSVAWWENTLALHASWGNTIEGWDYDPNGYYCVHPAFAPGQVLEISSTYGSVRCTIGDMVAPGDVGNWHNAGWAIEVAWPVFTALGLEAENWVTVTIPVPRHETPPGPRSRHFHVTGYTVTDPFLTFWEERGGLEIFGYPISEPLVENGISVQYFERARFEAHAIGILLGRVGAELIRWPSDVLLPGHTGTSLTSHGSGSDRSQ